MAPALRLQRLAAEGAFAVPLGFHGQLLDILRQLRDRVDDDDADPNDWDVYTAAVRTRQAVLTDPEASGPQRQLQRRRPGAPGRRDPGREPVDRIKRGRRRAGGPVG